MTDAQKNQIKPAHENYLRKLVNNLRAEATSIRFLVELFALAALIGYTCETRRTNNLTQQALDNSRTQFREEQRPYIWFAPSNHMDAPQLVSNGPHKGQLAVLFRFTNFGKSPGIDVREDARVAFGSNAGNAVSWREIASKHGSLAPPGDIGFNVAYSEGTLNSEETKAFQSGTLPVVIFGHFEYTDLYVAPPISYTSEFCFGSARGKLPESASDVGYDYCRDRNRIK
jgi:hypothetical protein